ncbi:aspartic proteinase nepenthesin-1-like [Curcuma longa]|uniref:aspartic proteinase nepenthesin-1-like n=1 Tax=Curcuma longa TaxID=136217 RepID=UPI003D9FA61D
MAHLFLFALLALSSSSSLPSIFAAHTAGLHLRLTHVDSGQPFSSTGRINRLVQRSHHRRKVLESRLRNSLPTSFDVPVKASMFDYFIEYSIGTPKLPVTGVLDTGSEVVWAKCRPCEQCDEEGISIYDPSKSSTFSKLPCSSPLYDYQPLKPFSVPKCQYVYVYGSAIINGFLATDAFSLGAESATANLTFGCNKLVKGTFSGASGVVGLGQGKLSLVSQLNLGRFSYCLTPFKSSSKSHLLLGDLARSTKRASSGEVQSTPLLNATDQYYVAMQGISIGGNRLPIPASTFEYSKEESSGAIFDSGTGQTQLPQSAFDAIKKELQSLVGLPVKDMSKTVGLDLCFRLSSWPPPPLPDMVFHFDNGADMRMPQMNYMFADQRTRAYCLVMRPGQNGDKLTIIGNYQQQNMHVIYDITSRMLLFESTSCESF